MSDLSLCSLIRLNFYLYHIRFRPSLLPTNFIVYLPCPYYFSRRTYFNVVSTVDFLTVLNWFISHPRLTHRYCLSTPFTRSTPYRTRCRPVRRSSTSKGPCLSPRAIPTSYFNPCFSPSFSPLPTRPFFFSLVCPLKVVSSSSVL